MTASISIFENKAFKDAKVKAVRSLAQEVALDAEDDKVAANYSASQTIVFEGKKYSVNVTADVKYTTCGGDSKTELSNTKFIINQI